jgi:GNAT superfamily N-acetyltransferase
VPDISATVRRLRAGDRDRWQELWLGYQRFYRADVTPEVTDATFAKLCHGGSGMVGLVAVDSADQPVGLAHLVFHPATWSAHESCYLEDLYVDPKVRGGAVSRALFQGIDEQARRHGADRVYWHTQQFNGRARSLYDTVGQLTSFVVYERPLD